MRDRGDQERRRCSAKPRRDEDRLHAVPSAVAPSASRSVGEQLERRSARGLDQHDVARPQHLATQQLAARRPGPARAPTPPRAAPGADAPVGYACRIGPDGHDRSTPAAASVRDPTRSCSLAASARARPSRRAPPDPPAVRPAIAASAASAAAHRLGVGVVGVVDDGDAVGAVGRPPSASGSRPGAPTARRRRRRAAAPTRQRGGGGRERVGHLVLARAACSAHRRVRSPRRRRMKRGRARVVEAHVRGAHVGVRAAADGRRTPRVGARRHARPPAGRRR